MQRPCDRCHSPYEAKTSRSKYCSSSCRARTSEAPKPKGAKPSTAVADALARELKQLGKAGCYEAVIALGIARQLDSDTVAGTAYASLSKELDRRVADLRQRGVKTSDPAAAAKAKVAQRRLHLA